MLMIIIFTFIILFLLISLLLLKLFGPTPEVVNNLAEILIAGALAIAMWFDTRLSSFTRNRLDKRSALYLKKVTPLLLLLILFGTDAYVLKQATLPQTITYERPHQPAPVAKKEPALIPPPAPTVVTEQEKPINMTLVEEKPISPLAKEYTDEELNTAMGGSKEPLIYDVANHPTSTQSTTTN